MIERTYYWGYGVYEMWRRHPDGYLNIYYVYNASGMYFNTLQEAFESGRS